MFATYSQYAKIRSATNHVAQWDGGRQVNSPPLIGYDGWILSWASHAYRRRNLSKS